MKFDIKFKLNEWDIVSLPNKPAVYFFYFRDCARPCYIGQTINLKRRMLEYQNGSQIGKKTHNEYLTFFLKSKKNIRDLNLKALYTTKEKVRNLESKYIDEFRPRYNIKS